MYRYIKITNLECKKNYENYYNLLKNEDYMYDTYFKPIPSYLLMKDNEKNTKTNNKNMKNIDENFYEGFGI